MLCYWHKQIEHTNSKFRLNAAGGLQVENSNLLKPGTMHILLINVLLCIVPVLKITLQLQLLFMWFVVNGAKDFSA